MSSSVFADTPEACDNERSDDLASCIPSAAEDGKKRRQWAKSDEPSHDRAENGR